jgi:hypothetical protein
VRRFVSIPLVLIGTFVIAFGSLVVWADHNLFDTPTVVRTTQQALDSTAVQQLLSREITDRIVTASGNEALRPQIASVVDRQLADPEFQSTFANAVSASHHVLVDGDARTIPFNLQPVAQSVEQQIVAVAPQLQGHLPDPQTVLQFDLVQRSQLPVLWRIVDHVRAVSWVVVALGVILVALGLLIGPARGVLLIVTGVSLAAFAGVIVLLAHTGVGLATRNASQLASDAANVISDAFLDDLVRQSVIVAAIGGIVAVAGLIVVAAGFGRADAEWNPPQYRTGWS